jgi:hypothetical protein
LQLRPDKEGFALQLRPDKEGFALQLRPDKEGVGFLSMLAYLCHQR